ncbi:hypothetical protein NLX83_32575 [Allokutzneria sp. A3M-2-11 16]|uniref:hypothetical protein n=1 Tax=Allokutzneria sp. A3M-2-11 16 TaxID=2962043 RepID=UPI0020B80C46|nr:hypothetical protein [Allokutzneria sp. A3M-2-11 16]MCP3804016.1 hypothetical protein [Allokutzneria sp. A3M-2-11 16]
MIRAGLIFLAVGQGLAGATQLFLPRVFYEHGPWVSMLPPYNEHLMRDVGALTLAYVFVLVVAAVTMERRIVCTALAANLVFTLPHFVFHAFHLEGYTFGAALWQTVLLGLGVLIPLALLYSVVFSRVRPS